VFTWRNDYRISSTAGSLSEWQIVLASVDHRPAPRDIADEQDDQDGEQKKRRAQVSRPEVKVGVNKINSDASPEDSPAATVAPARVNEGSKAERKHPGQRPKAAVRIGPEKRDQPSDDITNHLISWPDRVVARKLAGVA
jgi:hypothetical protein